MTGHSCGFYPPLFAHQTRLSCWFWLSLIDPLPLQLRPYYLNATADDREFVKRLAIFRPMPPRNHCTSTSTTVPAGHLFLLRLCVPKKKKKKKAHNAVWKPLNQPDSPICGKCISGAQLVPILSQRASRSIGELWHFAHIDSRAPLKNIPAYFPYLSTTLPFLTTHGAPKQTVKTHFWHIKHLPVNTQNQKHPKKQSSAGIFDFFCEWTWLSLFCTSLLSSKAT